MREIFKIEFDALGQGLPEVIVRKKSDVQKTVQLYVAKYRAMGWAVKHVRVSKGIRQDVVWEVITNSDL